jgi:hypothetical protein
MPSTPRMSIDIGRMRSRNVIGKLYFDDEDGPICGINFMGPVEIEIRQDFGPALDDFPYEGIRLTAPSHPEVIIRGRIREIHDGTR